LPIFGGFKTKNGRPLTLSNVYLILSNHFYHGTFEFLKNSNNWYQGKHTPLIGKDLFDAVQENIKEHYISKTESKEFAFTRLIKCGLCGSGITAEEKFKKLKDGGTNRHVYYLCTKARNIDCKNKYINEINLIKELIEIVDTIALDELGLKDKIERELKRYNTFRAGVLGVKKEKQSVTEVDIRNYAKYILREGTIVEKRELLSCLKSKLVLENRKIRLEK
jgi:hypothetical protein